MHTATEYSTPLAGPVLTIAHEKPCYSVDCTSENYSDSGNTSDQDLIPLPPKNQEMNPVTTSAAAKNTTNESTYSWLDRIEKFLISIRNKTEEISSRIDSNRKIIMNPPLDRKIVKSSILRKTKVTKLLNSRKQLKSLTEEMRKMNITNATIHLSLNSRRSTSDTLVLKSPSSATSKSQIYHL